MSVQIINCPNCGARVPAIHRVEENCEFCGTRLYFGNSTIPVEPLATVQVPHQKSRVTTRIGASSTRKVSKPIYWALTPLILLMLAMFVYGAEKVFSPDATSTLSDQMQRVSPPTAFVPVPPSANYWWENGYIVEWLTSVESTKLREKENVTNFVVFHENQVIYAKDQTFELNEVWINDKPYFLEAMSVIDTGVVVQVGGKQYNFNLYQPMTWKSAPSIIFMIDANGKVWVFDTSKNDIVTIQIESNEIPLTIKPNKNLEIGINK